MKLLSLDLRAFGKFTDHRMDFNKQGKSLHVIYGPNEAGKSTTLRALEVLFYGFPSTSSDAFLHPYNKLAVAAHIQLNQGKVYELLRLKGKKNSLRDEKNDVVLDANLPQQWLGVSQGLFASMFALDHQSLHTGGEDILAQKGDAGQALFSASTGQQQWHILLRQLEIEAEELFKNRGKNQAINKGCSQYQNLNKKISQASLSANQYQKTERQYQRTQQDLKESELLLKRQRHDLSDQQRILRLIPHMQTRHRLLREQAQRAHLPELEQDFFQQRRESKRQLDDLHIQQETLQQQCEHQQKQLTNCKPTQNVLLQQANIERLHADLAGFKKNRQNQTQLQIDILDLEQQLQKKKMAWMPQLSVEQFIQRQPDHIQRQRLEALQKTWQTLQAEKKQLDKQQQNAVVSLKRKAEHVQQLTSLLAQLRGCTELEKQQAEKQVEQKKLAIAIQNQWQQFPHCHMPFDRQEILSLLMPDQETILDMQTSYQALQQQLKNMQREQKQLESELDTVNLNIQKLQQQGHIPTEDEWLECCENRDQLWQKLVKGWHENLASLFVQAMQDADDLARQLYHEADRTGDYMQQLAEQDKLSKQLEKLNTAQAEWQTANTVWQTKWQQRWSTHIEAVTPPQRMLNCLEAYQQLCAEIQKEQYLQVELEAIAQQIQADKRQLTGLLPELSPALALQAMFKQAENMLRDAQEQQMRYVQQQQAQQQAQQQDDALAIKETEWCTTWQQNTAHLSPHQLEVHEVPLLLKAMDDIQQQHQHVERLKQQQQRLADEEQAFRQRLKVLHGLVPHVPDEPEDQIKQLKTLLDQQIKQQTLFDQYQAEVDGLEKEQTQLAAQKQQHQLRQQQFSRAAGGLKSDSDFAKLEKDLAEKQRLALDIQENSQHIRADLGHEELHVLQECCLNADADSLESHIQILQAQINESEQQLERQREAHSQAKVEFEQVRGDAQAADVAQDLALLHTDIIENVEKYQRLKLAAMVLKNKIEDYRQANQGEMLKQASHFFRLLTEQSFQSLSTDYNAKDQAVLVGLRADGSQVDVQGMSTGTRDQLYLALRLGFLKKRASQHESVPFIVDDILVHFDDARSHAAMQTLVDFSTNTQVLMFTHHQHICDMAKAFSGVQVHQL